MFGGTKCSIKRADLFNGSVCLIDTFFWCVASLWCTWKVPSSLGAESATGFWRLLSLDKAVATFSETPHAEYGCPSAVGNNFLPHAASSTIPPHSSVCVRGSVFSLEFSFVVSNLTKMKFHIRRWVSLSDVGLIGRLFCAIMISGKKKRFGQVCVSQHLQRWAMKSTVTYPQVRSRHKIHPRSIWKFGSHRSAKAKCHVMSFCLMHTCSLFFCEINLIFRWHLGRKIYLLLIGCVPVYTPPTTWLVLRIFQMGYVVSHLKKQ